MLPLSLAGTWVLAGRLAQWPFSETVPLAFITGAGVYLIMHLLLWKPIFIHVMGHELTHAFWAVLLGGKIKSLLVSQTGGQVTLSKTNFLIALAPYFFPLYTFLVMCLYLISAPKFYPLLAFLSGATLMFHLALTLHSLRDEQSDIRDVGVFFSLSFVYLMNLLGVVVVLSVVVPSVISLPGFFQETLGFLIQWAEWAWKAVR